MNATQTHMAPLRALEAQRLLDLAAFKIIPALCAGGISYLHVNDLGVAAIVAASMFFALQLVERPSLPLELMPAARLALGTVAPVLGITIAVLIMLAASHPVPVGHLEAAVIGAWLVMALGSWVKVRFEEGRRARVAVAGSPEFAADLAAELETAGIRAYEVVGWFGREAPAIQAGRGLECLGSLDGIRATVLHHNVELIVCARDDGSAHGSTGRDPSETIAEACLDLPVRMMEANQLYEELLGHVPLGTTDDAWFRYIMHPRFRPTAPLWKRTFDVVCATAIGLMALPVLVVAAAMIKLSDGGSVLYRQRRIGEGGREFEIIKLRTMRADAEANGPQWSVAGDERVTALGRFLRRTHLDELPQVINVLRGDMTMVGPRPERPHIVSEMEERYPHYNRRHLVKPGIAGWAQLRCGYGGSDIGTAWKLCHDLFYVKQRSLLADCLILVETTFEATRDAHRALPTPQQRFIVGQASD